ncbi:RNA polymerase sigma factor [Aequorivita sp. H23M31]|uniref:RNA polymerase sigma factor n=1 Tax=Aequorivita ciconiae TaxID=2494375 RepID=A0A410G706_9FLAO|nr:RNA polymerase sigma factor [Aequorivita sp. H23M31]QAA83067.1 RNA polymerase sigma factor [Aequorivita sp. H23M31]
MDKQEFIETFIPLKDRLYRLSKRILISNDEAEDAVQEVLLKLWKGKENIGNYKSPEAFAITVTKNYCLDRLKSKQASNLKIVHSNYPTSQNLEREVEANEEVGLVFKIMDSLPEQQRIVLQLRDVEQLEFSEIAHILDSNETAVRVTLSRARKTVREAMIKKYNYGITQY